MREYLSIYHLRWVNKHVEGIRHFSWTTLEQLQKDCLGLRGSFLINEGGRVVLAKRQSLSQVLFLTLKPEFTQGCQTI